MGPPRSLRSLPPLFSFRSALAGEKLPGNSLKSPLSGGLTEYQLRRGGGPREGTSEHPGGRLKVPPAWPGALGQKDLPSPFSSPDLWAKQTKQKEYNS